ncbi:glycerol kinase GlpK [Tomitella fengzijianii]|uniref:Glycerol kinase n=1 Tax=Tomitella fengzijianii TaxID=2597660 RepID=A0A516X101_9ACTN|nr:glycerol kinase GlpK [Tomitella fengzijianii]QDQ96764.1 glycerol kinase GlpK [Tomitella fengzijianii]
MTDANTPHRGGYIAAIDQGTTSSRCIIFDHDGRIVDVARREHRQIFPHPGWVEHDAQEIWINSRSVTGEVLASSDIPASEIAAIGITNQRETTVVWDRATGEPVYNAIVWQDTRTAEICERLAAGAPDGSGIDRYRAVTGLPLSPYFSGTKLAWILENVDGVRERAEAGELCFGTMDTWLMWNLSGGTGGPGQEPGIHVTDVTNASRTLLMDLTTLQWDERICEDMGIPVSMLPEIRSSSEEYCRVRRRSVLGGVPVAGILGDQQAAMFGQACLEPGDAKNTYGTGNFLLLNTGTEPVHSDKGLLTTVCYRLGDQPAVYALEGSVAVSGSLVQWLRDNLGLISSSSEVEPLAASVDDNGGAYLVPAFSGLFAPRWRPDARGVLVGLTRYVTKAHIARAALEATAFQSREVIEAAMESGLPVGELRVDGGMVVNELLMQFQADILGVPVTRPAVIETTALGAAYAAGLAVGYWSGTEEIRRNWSAERTWEPSMPAERREELYARWNQAVERTYGWVQD